jgi:hypothetical protein
VIAYYRDLLRDTVRVEAYRKAIVDVVEENDIVVEIGTGIGTYAQFAARAGARKVFAVEQSPIIHLAREIARDNGLADRIEFLHGHSSSSSLPDKADVLIIEEFESFYFTQALSRVMARAEGRLLKPDAISVPRAVSLFVAPIDSPELHESVSFAGQIGRGDGFGIDWARADETAMNSHHVRDVPVSSLLAPGQKVRQLSLPREYDDSFVSHASFDSRGGTVHGLAGWFELRLSDDVTLSTAPGRPATCWSQSYFPIEGPVPAPRGESIDVTFKHLRARGGLGSWYAWELSTGTATRRGSTFQGASFSLDELREKDRRYVPSLGAEQRIRREILQAVDGHRSIEAIATILLREFPEELQSLEEACARVSGEISP